MVKALHRAGIEVILDVVFNHTAEGLLTARPSASAAWPTARTTSSTRTRRATPITADAATRSTPTIRSSGADRRQPPALGEHMHVDGFRFDLASILSRDPSGRPMASPPVLWDIESDPVLANAS
jgi:glycogen operon protein